MKPQHYNSQIDYVYFIISNKLGINYNTLKTEYAHEFTLRKITTDSLDWILAKLTKDGYIAEGQTGYFQTPDGENFYGYAYEKDSQKANSKWKTKLDSFVQIGGIFLTLAFGTSTWYFDHEKEVSDQTVKQQSVIITSLQKKLNVDETLLKKLLPPPLYKTNKKQHGNG